VFWQAFGELGAESRVDLGIPILRVAVEGAFQFDRGTTGANGETIEAGGKRKALNQSCVGL